MNRSEALTPLKAGEGYVPVTAGVVIRGQLRKAALLSGIDYYEDKDWLESTFIFRGPADKLMRFYKWAKQNFGDED